MKKVCLIMLCGLPGSGKSTYAEKLSQKGYKIYSFDKLKMELYNDLYYNTKNCILYNELYKRITLDLKNGNNVIYDATNIYSSKRISFLNYLIQHNVICKKSIHILNTEYNECLNRNNNRKKFISKIAIDKMYHSFETPFYNEGWDEIKLVNTGTINIYNEYEKMNGFNQENSHHTLKLDEHCKKALYYIENIINDMFKNTYINIMNCNALKVATLLHDIGKPNVKTHYRIDGTIDKNGDYHYYGHASVGAYMLLCTDYNSLKILNNYIVGDYKEFLLIISQLISYHMKMYFYKTDKQKEKAKKTYGITLYDNLSLLHEADLYAH